ncbi:MAG: zinc ribbon domain-containing protein [Clostridia bacterium]|nr:zinc ribbon domain-containing protein [Clostridia bacterium]MDH7572855.1 zinc ribbon domain-containing protein [Clostridia bacterium]
MPTYDYRCRSCGARWEVSLRHASDRPSACPTCGGEDVERLFSAPYVLRSGSRPSGRTCCGREERCAEPPCGAAGTCRRG